jgi:replicative DNA helicase
MAFLVARDIIRDTFEKIDRLDEDGIKGLPTYFEELDEFTGGIKATGLTLIAGPSGVGAKASCRNAAELAAIIIKERLPVAIFSFDKSKEQIFQMMLALLSRVDIKKIKNGCLADEDFEKLTEALGLLYDAPIYINDSPLQTIADIRDRISKWGDMPKLVVVDNLQLVQGGEKDITEITKSLEAMAKEFNIPFFVISEAVQPLVIFE